MRKSIRKLFGNCDYVFQHDNDPKHTAEKIKKYLENADINVLEWPPYSPDLNPIEHLWKVLDEQTKDRRPKNEMICMNYWKKNGQIYQRKQLKNLLRSCLIGVLQ